MPAIRGPAAAPLRSLPPGTAIPRPHQRAGPSRHDHRRHRDRTRHDSSNPARRSNRQGSATTSLMRTLCATHAGRTKPLKHPPMISLRRLCVPGAGLEPARLLGQPLLRRPCLPFHHPGGVRSVVTVANPGQVVESACQRTTASGASAFASAVGAARWTNSSRWIAWSLCSHSPM